MKMYRNKNNNILNKLYCKNKNTHTCTTTKTEGHDIIIPKALKSKETAFATAFFLLFSICIA